jgi:NADPH2 dehydrogenase
MNNLFSEISISNKKFSNRIVLPPMATEKANIHGEINDDIVNYYHNMAQTGISLLIMEHCYVMEEGKLNNKQISISKDSDVNGHKRVVNAIHDSKIFTALQINHAGSNKSENVFDIIYGPSSVKNPKNEIIPEELTIQKIAEIVKAFGDAGRRAKESGYDMVEIHSAHGFLINQFLSPLTNIRKDKYGGDTNKRMLVLKEIVEEIRGKTGKEYPIMVRLGISDNPPNAIIYKNGLSLKYGIEIAKVLESLNIFILDISGGMCGSRPSAVNEDDYFVHFAKEAKLEIKTPLIITGGIINPENANNIIKSGYSDFVGIGRALVADNDWVKKANKILVN